MKRHTLASLLIAATGLLNLTACDEDTAIAPSYRTDWVELLTNNNGAVDRMVRDNGDTLFVNNPRYGFGPDTLYRYLATYTADEGQRNRVRIYGLSPILLLQPMQNEDESVISDPVIPLSIWRGGNYLNLRLKIRTRNQGHYFGLVYDAIGIYPDGRRTLFLTLFHHRNGDPESFSRQVDLSCPLDWVEGKLQRGRDSILLRLNSETEGIKSYTLPY